MHLQSVIVHVIVHVIVRLAACGRYGPSYNNNGIWAVNADSAMCSSWLVWQVWLARELFEILEAVSIMQWGVMCIGVCMDVWCGHVDQWWGVWWGVRCQIWLAQNLCPLISSKSFSWVSIIGRSKGCLGLAPRHPVAVYQKLAYPDVALRCRCRGVHGWWMAWWVYFSIWCSSPVHCAVGWDKSSAPYASNSMTSGLFAISCHLHGLITWWVMIIQGRHYHITVLCCLKSPDLNRLSSLLEFSARPVAWLFLHYSRYVCSEFVLCLSSRFGVGADCYCCTTEVVSYHSLLQYCSIVDIWLHSYVMS